jgi:hypothetical protein
MNKIFFCIILFQFKTGLLSAQIGTVTKIRKDTLVEIDRLKEQEKKIKTYADSINSYTSGELPQFLFNECFDLDGSLWKGFHSPVSLRWDVLNLVTNKIALKKILDVHDKKLEQKCNYSKGTNPEIVIPLIDKSFYQLILERYQKLN